MINLPRSTLGRWMATVIVGCGIAVAALPMTAKAGIIPPFFIDGVIPDDGCPSSMVPNPPSGCVELNDPSLGDKELGPVNNTTTKLGSIHTAIPSPGDPMLGFTNPNGNADLNKIWLETRKDDDEDIWLYFAWQRDSASTSQIAYEFQQAELDPDCDYSLTDQVEPMSADEETLIANCNPWSGRKADDFMIVFDFEGSDVEIWLRTFDGAAFDFPGVLVSDPSLNHAAGTVGIFGDGTQDYTRGEGAINLSDSIFADLPDSCLSVANIIPGTIAGNSDTADYKDTVLADISSAIAISNCGTVTVTKTTVPSALDGSFPYTLDKVSGPIMYPADVVPGPCNTTACSDVLTSGGDTDFLPDLLPDTDYRLVENLDSASTFLLKSIVCDGVDVTTEGSTFPVAAATNTDCTITNELLTGTVTVIKEVVNIIPDNASPSDFCLSLDDGETSFAGSGLPGSKFTLVVDTPYTVTEVACGNPDTSPPGYMATFEGACNDKVEAWANKTCTVTNIQQEQDTVSLALFKKVITDNGGTATSSDWTLSATLKAGAPLTCGAGGFSGKDTDDGVGVPGSVSLSDSLATCVYELSETGGPSNYTAMGWSCTGDHSLTNGNELTVGGSGPVTCTITNDDDTPSLTLVKNVTKDNGGTADAADWTLTANGPTPISGQGGATSDATFDAGVYTLSESGGPAGYADGDWSCTNGITVDAQNQISIGLGQSTTCSITNDDTAPGLTLVKNVTKDNGGTATATDWMLKADGPTTIAGAGGANGDASFSAGTYTLSESGGPAGYSAGAWTCTNGIAVNAQDQITLTEGQSTTCSITNDDDAPSLTLVKNVTKDNGGTADAADWTLTASGPTPISGAGGTSSDGTFSAGTYTLSESDGPAGYSAGAWTCTNGIAVDAQNQITLTEGQSTTCSITNDDDAPSLTLVKALMTDNGGTALTTNWTLTANGPTPISGAGGATSDATFSAGTYSLSESGGPAGYTASSWTCVGGSQTGDQITLTEGQSATCTITNNDIAPSLTLIKQVVTDNGGDAVAPDWTLSASGPSPISGSGGASSDDSFLVGTYALSESGGPTGYSAGEWNCVGGIQSGDQITLTEGVSATCTIINDDIAPTLTLVKNVVNDHHPAGLGLQPDDFALTITGSGGQPVAASSGVPVSLNAGSYVASETNQPGYEAGLWGGDCGNNGSVSLSVGENKTCSITNDDIPAELVITKTPDPEDGVRITVDQDAQFTITVKNLGGGNAYNVVLTDTLPAPADGLTALTWFPITEGCVVTGGVNLSCNIGLMPMDPTPDQRDSGDESSFSVTVISDIPDNYLYTLGTPGGSGTLGSNFEVDGDLMLDGANPPLIDWENAQTVAASVEGFFANELDPPLVDLSPFFETENSFGEGTKNDDPVPTVVDSSVPPNKSDLTNFLVTQDIVEGNLYVVLGWLRVDSTGTSNFDFELNQSRELTTNGATPERTDGDVIISFDFGGTGDDLDYLRLSLREWDADAEAWGPPRELSAEGTAFGAVNDPVRFGTDLSGEPNPLDGGAIIPHSSFGEAIVNVTKTFGGDCKIFLSAYVKGRSSDSFTSSMKDFITPLDVNINSCRTVTLPNEATVSAFNHDPVSDTGTLDVTNDLDVFDAPSHSSLAAMDALNGSGHVGVSAAVWDRTAKRQFSHVHDAAERSLLATLPLTPGEMKAHASVGDMNGDGSDDLAVLAVESGSFIEVKIKDGLTGTLISKMSFEADYRPLWMRIVPDSGGDGWPDVAVLGLNGNGIPRAQVRDAMSGALVSKVFFESVYTFGFEVIDDTNGNGFAELALLGIDSTGRARAQVKDVMSGELVTFVNFERSYLPTHATGVDMDGDGANDGLAVLARNSGGVIRAQVKDVATGSRLGIVQFEKSYTPLAMVSVPDANGTGAPELAVLQTNQGGKVRAQVKDIVSGAKVSIIGFSSKHKSRDLVVLPDADGDGRAELAYLGEDTSDGTHLLQVKDAGTGQALLRMVVEPYEPAP